MNLQTMMIVIALAFVFLAYYSQASLRNKCFCTFRRPNKTKVEKWVPYDPKNVRILRFGGAEYVIDPERVVLLWYTRGLNAFFPSWVPSLDFTWRSDVAFDDFGQATWATPEARKALHQEENIKALDRSEAATSGKKESGFQRLLPWLTLAGLVLVGFIVYKMSGDLASIGNQISIIRSNLPIQP